MRFFDTLITDHAKSLKGKGKPPRQAGMRPNADEEGIHIDFNEAGSSITGTSAVYKEAQDREIIERLSEIYGVPKNSLFLTPGADEAIRYLTQALCDPGDKVLIHTPTYGSYQSCAASFRAAAHDIPLKREGNDFQLETKKIIDTINTENTGLKLVYICNPNNPTGSYFDENHVEDILKAAKQKNIGVVVDEAYIEFSGMPSITQRLNTHENLIVLRTLSKAYSMAGERIGVVICQDQNLLDAIYTFTPAFAIPVSAMDKTREVLKPENEQAFHDQRTRIAEQRDALLDAITEVKGLTAFRSVASCLVVGTHEVESLLKHLSDNRIFAKGFPNLGVRLSVEDNLEQNASIADIIQQWPLAQHR